MSKSVVVTPKKESTRDRILKAAMLRFATHSYEETGFRDLAADVNVDPAYVHRCFGAKEKLFYEVVKASSQPERIFSGDPQELASTLAREVFVQRAVNEGCSLNIIVRSCASADTSRMIRDFIMQDFIAPMREKRPSLSEKHAAAIVGLLIGVGIMKDVLGVPTFLSQEEAPEEFLATMIEMIMGDDLNMTQILDDSKDGISSSL